MRDLPLIGVFTFNNYDLKSISEFVKTLIVLDLPLEIGQKNQFNITSISINWNELDNFTDEQIFQHVDIVNTIFDKIKNI